MDEQMVEQESFLTFSEIFRLLKKGWVILVIAVLIGIILATSLLLVLREAMGTTNYETQITFSSASISDEDGFNPSTKVNTLIKSNAIISNAMAALGYTEETQKALINGGLIENLSAYANVSKTDNEGVSYPYTVTLSLKKFSNKALSKAQSAALIEEITKQVILELQMQYKKEISFSKLESIDYTKYNYLQAYDKLDSAIDTVSIYKSGLSQNTLNYSQNGKTIKSILEKFDEIKNEIEAIKLTLINNTLTNATATTSELEYAVYEYNYYSQKATQLNDRITAYATLLKDTKPDITVTSGTVSTEALVKYYELIDVYNDLQSEYIQTLQKKQQWEDIKTAYSGSTTPSVAVQTQINAIIMGYNSTYDELNAIIGVYNEDSYASNLVFETKAISVAKDSAISALIIALVDVVVIALIMIVVVIYEKKKENKQETKKEGAKA